VRALGGAAASADSFRACLSDSDHPGRSGLTWVCMAVNSALFDSFVLSSV